ncbi:MAG: SDR family oxidoreductase [Hahellaceae bacterium]|nr:SDR family oxidoreductase [Hahellaceae bacterium]MCP5212330.1 SDR family oxidoreductase [Hahellaceae bacterium]
MEKRVFITGGASGLGKEMALLFARKGYRVCIGDVNPERGFEAEAELSRVAPQALYLHCDVTKLADLESVRDTLIEKWGGVDIVVNNAGVGGTAGWLEDVSLEDWEWVIDINLLGVVRGCRAFTPLFKKQKSGYFVNVASVAGLMNAPMMSNYNVTKAAVISLSETLRVELEPYGIYTSVVCPAFFPTNLTENLRSTVGGVHSQVNKLMKRSGVTALQVAQAVAEAVEKKEFWVVTHRLERNMWKFKRLWPDGFSMLMKQQSKKLFPQAIK